MWTEDYRWHFDYVRLAWDAGFSFEKNKYPNLDKNKICLVDVDRVVKERDVASIERFIPVVVQYILESDQAEVLDTNFVKMFRMSQLTVEYLLFCKRYLDNTVVLLKKEVNKLKEQNKELKLFTQDLENHILTLTNQSNLVTTFKCEKCSKAFSTEEYLYSHVKRRHNSHSEESKTNDLQTDILQSEIKELKERLNVTEKLLQEKEEKTEKAKGDSAAEENKIKVEEIQEKFENFKERVENDIKILQIQKNFYEDKYSKLFDIVIQANNKENISSNIVTQKIEPTRKENNIFTENVVSKIETTTQTDKESNTKKLQIETIQDKNVFDFKDSGSLEDIEEKTQDVEDTVEQKIMKFEENIESKISSSLNNIQNQMEAFWGKLSELELKREKELLAQQNRQSNLEESPKLKALVTRSLVETSKPLPVVSKPKIKPRTKLTTPQTLDDSKANTEVIERELEKMYSNNVSRRNVSEKKLQLKIGEKSSAVLYDSSATESETEVKSESIVEIMPKKSYESKPSVSTIGRKSFSSVKSSVTSKESLDKLLFEMNDLVNDRLQEMGISPNWRGIPQKTFERAMAIVDHQASLSKKMYPEYDRIKKSIEKSLKSNKILLSKGGSNRSKISISPKKEQQNVINIRYRRVSKEIEDDPEQKTQTLTIKNRSLYDDTESDSGPPNAPTSHSQPLPAYSDVIAELKTTQKKNSDTDSDLTSLILPQDDVRNEPHTKSALKNYPSMGSLTKKKVIFDIQTDEKVISAEGNSNVALGGQEKVSEKSKGKNDDSLSDFDLSDY